MTDPIKTVKSGGFEFETGVAIPPAARNVRISEIGQKLAAMPVGASFLEPVEVPDTIKDAGERAKAFKDEARKVSNRLSGATRRFREANPGFAFLLRTVDDATGKGVRVWRTEAQKEEPKKA